MKRLDILNLEWPDSDRDLHIVTPSLVYLQKKYNIEYKTKSIFNAYYYLIKYRPKMLLMSNFVGANINFNIASLANILNIQVVSFISEGNFKEEELDLYLYGKSNKNLKIVVDKYLLWNSQSQDFILKKYKLEDILVVTGATGFDRYKLLQYKNKEQFLLENGLKYKNIIGIAGWAFGIMFNENKEYYNKIYGHEQVKMHQEDLIKINKIYKNLIVNNPNILFILRYHPATINLKEDEFINLEQYENVFISNKYKNNNYPISDLINISDLWIGYETTTALESWLLGKQTFLINPSRSNFIRENVHIGSPIAKNTKEAQVFIEEYLEDGTIKAFECLSPLREKIIKNVIEHGDGKNYIRASEEIIKVFNNSKEEINLNATLYGRALKQIVKLILSKTIMKNRWQELKYSSDFAKSYQKMYNKVIDV